MTNKSLQQLKQSKRDDIFPTQALNPRLIIKHSIRSADSWIRRLLTSTNAIWNQLPPSPGNTQPVPQFDHPVKIAVIDTGAAIEASVLDVYDNRLTECRSWVGKDRARLIKGSTIDKVGHGTHVTSLVLKITENTNCEIYVAQVFEGNPQQQSPSDKDWESKTEAIALVSFQPNISRLEVPANKFKAIEHAVQRWKVDIISLSFGTSRAVDIIEKVINEHAHKTLFFAAASNCGGNEPGISWPARHDSVISMYASDADGNSYMRNPNPIKNHYNLSMLGTAVPGLWPQHLDPTSRCKHRSGTSCATPIAAGVAANILTLMRRQATLNLLSVPKDALGKAVQDTEHLLKKLRRPQIMTKVMYKIGAQEIERDHYHYVAPWHIFKGSPQVAFKRIKDVVDAS
jgi:subtilisin family serine protease